VCMRGGGGGEGGGSDSKLDIRASAGSKNEPRPPDSPSFLLFYLHFLLYFLCISFLFLLFSFFLSACLKQFYLCLDIYNVSSTLFLLPHSCIIPLFTTILYLCQTADYKVVIWFTGGMADARVNIFPGFIYSPVTPLLQNKHSVCVDTRGPHNFVRMFGKSKR
jgi:hypothetical protein